MRVAIAALSSSAHLSGVSRHAANMAQCLLTRADVSSVFLLVADWQYDSFRGAVPFADSRLRIERVSIGKSLWSRNLWYYHHLPALALKLEADIVHLAYPAPLRSKGFQCPTVVTLHDLYPYDIPGNFGFPKVLFNRLILQQCLHAVDAIACVSESTLRRLEIYTSRAVQKKATTIYNCVESTPATAAQRPPDAWNGAPFLLCVAQHRRNKNVVLAMEVFRRLLLNGDISPAAQLMIVGIEGPETARIQRFLHDSGLARQIVLLHGVDDAELQWCYGHCELLLAPSSVEGFGLPIVEAMLHHCRIVCSDIPAFREVGGAYCHYASLKPPEEQAFIDATRNALSSVKLRKAETERFSGPRIADAYMKLYTRLLANRAVVAAPDTHITAYQERGRP